MPADWPTTTEVTTRLTEMGISPLPSETTLQSLIDSIVQDWEGYTGFSPFASDGEETTEYFSAVGNIVDFRGGLIGTPSSFVIGGYYNESGVYTGGQTLVIGRDYQLMRSRRNWPYTYAKLNG